MPAHVWNGSAWKKVLRKTMWTGSAWKDIKSSHRWTGSAWETIYSSFMPSGMTKNGNETVSNSWSALTGWAADAGSTVSGSGLVANGSKAGALVSAEVSWRSGGNSRTITARLKVNGTIVATGAGTTGSGDGNLWTSTVSTTTNVLAGDVATIEVISANSTGNPTILAGSATWVRIA